eukprot:2422830-Prymnesium_polylepis.1
MAGQHHQPPATRRRRRVQQLGLLGRHQLIVGAVEHQCGQRQLAQLRLVLQHAHRRAACGRSQALRAAPRLVGRDAAVEDQSAVAGRLERGEVDGDVGAHRSATEEQWGTPIDARGRQALVERACAERLGVGEERGERRRVLRDGR